MYKDVEVTDGSSIINPAANTDITINAAEDTNVTIKRTGEAKGAMIRADKNSDNGNAFGARKITLGAAGGTLTISDEVTSGVERDQGTFMLGGDNEEEAITLGPKAVVNRVSGNYIVFSWSTTHAFTVDGADLSKITDKYISSIHPDARKANVIIKNAAKLGELKLNTEKANVYITGYTGEAIPLTIDVTLTEGLVIASGSPDKLSFTNDSFVLAAGTGENDGKIVLAAKSNDIEATPLDNDFDDGSMGWTAALTVEEGKTVDLTNPKWIISNDKAKTTSVKASVSEEFDTTVTGGSYMFGLVLTKTAIGDNTIDKVWFSY